MKITKRDILFFIIGVLTMFVFESVYDWQGTKAAIKKGWNDGYSSVLKK